jgi:hypothetical protein
MKMLRIKFIRAIINVLLLLFLSILFSCTNHSTEAKNIADYRIAINCYGMTWDDKYLFTPDSIVVTPHKIVQIDTIGVFRKKLTESERQSIMNALSQINFEEIKEMNINNSAPDDMAEFDFEITVNSKTKKIHIYQVRVDDILALVKQLNQSLPPDYKLGYNEEYFRYLK